MKVSRKTVNCGETMVMKSEGDDEEEKDDNDDEADDDKTC